MNRETILKKLNSTILCLMAHPDNEPNSEFADRIDDLINLQDHFSSLTKEETPYCCEAKLREAAEKVQMIVHDGHFKTNSYSKHVQVGANNIQIDKESILSLIKKEEE